VGCYHLAGGCALGIRVILIMRRNICILDICALKLTVWFIVLCVFLVSSTFLTAGERIIVEGIVDATKDPNGNIIAVKLNLKAEGGNVFNIILDEIGKKLGKEMDGKWAEVIGNFFVEGDKTWLEVKSYKKAEGGV